MNGYILIVEDSVELRDALAELLVYEGFRVRTAEHGRRALEVVGEAGVPALILLDLMMPVMDGWQLLAELRRAPGRAMRSCPPGAASATPEFDGHIRWRALPFTGARNPCADAATWPAWKRPCRAGTRSGARAVG